LVKHRRCRAAVRAAADARLLEKIQVLKSEHPFWGYRRIWAYLSIRRPVVGQPKARLSAFERKRFTGQSLDAPFGKTDESDV